MPDDPPAEIFVHVSYVAQHPIVTVEGDVGSITVSSLAGVVNAMIADGHRDIEVDLAGVSFIDAHAVDVLTDLARRAVAEGGSMTLRSAPSIAGAISGVVHTGDRSQRAAASMRGVVPASSNSDLTDAALRLVTAVAGATVTNADGVSVTLERHGRLMTVAATDDAVLTMDRHQYETGEGPCLAARAEGRWYYIESLDDETRWPKFVPLALEQGIHSVLSSPLMTQDRPQGALNMYSSKQFAFGIREQGLAALFAQQASEILTTAAGGVSDEEAARRFAESMEARRPIHQAQGVIMGRDGVSAQEAFITLASDPRTAKVTVLARAIDVLASIAPAGEHD